MKSQPGKGYELLLPGGGLVLIGLAMVLVKDLREAGLYCVAAGVVVVAGLALLGRRQGLNAPAPPLAGPTALPHTSPSRDRCPMCGGTDLLVMNPRESVAFYGYDRFVLYMPRRCANCGHGFEIHPGVLGCYLLAGFSLLGVLFGLTLTLLGPFTGYMILFNRGEKGVDWRVLAGVVVCPAFGLIVMWRFIKETVRYWRLSKGPGRGELPAPSGDPD